MEILTSNSEALLAIFLAAAMIYALSVTIRLAIDRRKEDREEELLRKRRKEATTPKPPSHH